jgi:hypothetical protein
MELNIKQQIYILRQGDSSADLNKLLIEGWRVKSVSIIKPINSCKSSTFGHYDGKSGEAHYLLERSE